MTAPPAPPARREGDRRQWHATIRDPTTGEPVTDFAFDGVPIVNNIDHPTLFWGELIEAMIRSWRVEEETGDGNEGGEPDRGGR